MTRPTWRGVIAHAAASLLAAPAAAQPDSITELEAVIVTAPSEDGTALTSPFGVSVIGAGDIERSTATNVGELLSREANVNLQSFFGNDRFATVDIRGMGATATSNVLVLVDGVRLNETDLSGADLSSIPLAQIERVEIVRGGGAVRYGNGAVGGVINIITKRARPGALAAEAVARRGSYDTTDLRFAGRAGAGSIAAAVTAAKYDTEGYRQNGFVDARDVAGEIRWLPDGALDFLELYVRAAEHRNEVGLPGPVSAETFAAGSAERRASRAPFDRSETTDTRYTVGGTVDLDRFGRLDVQASRRDRDNPYLIGFSPIVPLQDQQSSITAERRDVTARYTLPFELLGRRHSASVGVDALDADYLRRENGESVLSNSTRRSGTVDSHGYYAETTVRGPAGLALNAGVRTDRFSTRAVDERYTRGDCRTVFETVLVDILPGPGVILVPIQVPRQAGCVDAYRPQATSGGTWRNRAAEVGATWQASTNLTAFASFSQHFRNPNVDELLLAAADLRPQTGRTYQGGARYVVADRLELAATVFDMTVNDEIYFGLDPRTGFGLNRNFENPTRRAGTELEARWRPLRSVALRANLGYVRPRFRGVDADIPLVPRTTAAAEVEWTMVPGLRWGFSARYVGPRYDGNDFSNTLFPRLPSYTVCDSVVRFEHRGIQISAGINNLFNEVYSTIAYSATYYPMPERNYYVAIRARF